MSSSSSSSSSSSGSSGKTTIGSSSLTKNKIVKMKPIKTEEDIMTLDLHPERELISLGLVDGNIDLWQYGAEEGQKHKKLMTFEEHEYGCRDVLFSGDGKSLFTASSDLTINTIDMEKMDVVNTWEDAHETSINKLAYKNNILVSGDDKGTVKVWDLRKDKSIFTFKEHTDFISSFVIPPDHPNQLLCGSGDGTLSVLHMRKGTLVAASDNQETDILSMCLMKFGQKVVIGQQDGVLGVFSWDKWGDVSDRFPGHPQSVDAMVKLDESTLLTGSIDGVIRVVSIQPNKLLGVIGQHKFPISRMETTYDNRFLASTSHNNMIKFWDISYLFEEEDQEEQEEEDSDEEDSDEEEEEEKGGKKKGKEEKEEKEEQGETNNKGGSADSDDSDDSDVSDDSDDDDSDDDDDDSDDESEEEYESVKRKRFEPQGQKGRGGQQKKRRPNSFFSGL